MQVQTNEKPVDIFEAGGFGILAGDGNFNYRWQKFWKPTTISESGKQSMRLGISSSLATRPFNRESRVRCQSSAYSTGSCTPYHYNGPLERFRTKTPLEYTES
jgi:hypothetical protein